MEKIFELSVVTGSYTNQQGEKKNRYLNIGSVMKNDKGMFMFLNRSFSPAGITAKEGSESIIVSMFPPKQKEAVESEIFNQSAIPF